MVKHYIKKCHVWNPWTFLIPLFLPLLSPNAPQIGLFLNTPLWLSLALLVALIRLLELFTYLSLLLDWTWVQIYPDFLYSQYLLPYLAYNKHSVFVEWIYTNVHFIYWEISKINWIILQSIDLVSYFALFNIQCKTDDSYLLKELYLAFFEFK